MTSMIRILSVLARSMLWPTGQVAHKNAGRARFVLRRDPLKKDASTFVTISIKQTIVGGRWLYQS